MASCSKAFFSSKLDICSPFSSRPPLSLLPNFSSSFSSTTFFAFGQLKEISLRYSFDLQHSSSIINKAQPQPRRHICRAAEYKFPDPIPEFAVAETEKFKTHLSKKLTKKDLYGDSLEEVVGICTETIDVASIDVAALIQTQFKQLASTTACPASTAKDALFFPCFFLVKIYFGGWI